MNDARFSLSVEARAVGFEAGPPLVLRFSLSDLVCRRCAIFRNYSMRGSN